MHRSKRADRDARASAQWPQALAQGVQIESRISDRNERVLGDESRLQQVVWDLLSNSIELTPKGGRIEVSAQVRNDCCKIVVADTGQGINPELLPRMFDRFSQQDSGSSRSFRAAAGDISH